MQENGVSICEGWIGFLAVRVLPGLAVDDCGVLGLRHEEREDLPGLRFPSCFHPAPWRGVSLLMGLGDPWRGIPWRSTERHMMEGRWEMVEG